MRRCSLLSNCYTKSVSIHAPGRGATGRAHYVSAKEGVSIHAPGRGATLRSIYARLHSRSFNSRTREGCDARVLSSEVSNAEFQFTHPGGVRLWLRAFVILATMFQFTHPGGVRRARSNNGNAEEGFNSRTREGCDFQGFSISGLLSVSIHAPGRGATERCAS